MTRQDRDSARQRAHWAATHAGHDITTLARRRLDGSQYRWCLTCRGGDGIDPVAVQRAVAGDPPGRLTPAERRAAVAQLHPRLSGARIAARLGVTDRTIWRDLATIRAIGAAT